MKEIPERLGKSRRIGTVREGGALTYIASTMEENTMRVLRLLYKLAHSERFKLGVNEKKKTGQRKKWREEEKDYKEKDSKRTEENPLYRYRNWIKQYKVYSKDHVYKCWEIGGKLERTSIQRLRR